MNDVELQERFDVVKEVAISAGERALEFFKDRSQLLVQHKGPQDLNKDALTQGNQTLVCSKNIKEPLMKLL